MTGGNEKAGKAGGKQSTLRKMNRRLILEFISEEKLSCMDLAHKCGLSYTGVITLVDGLLKDGIVKKIDAEATSLGRRPIWVEMARGYGMVCVVNYTEAPFWGLYALDGECLFSERFGTDGQICRADVDALAERIASVRQERFPEVRLLHMAVAVPGKVDKRTGGFVFAPHFKDCKNINLRTVFGERLQTQVTVKNDLLFSLIAEKEYGALKAKIHDTLFLQFGYGFGCSLYLNGKLYESRRGHGGEIGMFITDYGTGFLNTGENLYFQQLGSYERLLRTAQTMTGEEVTLDAFVAQYHAGNSLAVKLVEEFASVVAGVIKSLATVIDFDSVVITSQSLAFGEKFLSLLGSRVNVGGPYSDIGLYRASFGVEGITLGAKKFAIRRAIDQIS